MSRLRFNITMTVDGYVAGQVVPLLLGGGTRLFDSLHGADTRLEPVRTVEGPGVTHLKYRVIR